MGTFHGKVIHRKPAVDRMLWTRDTTISGSTENIYPSYLKCWNALSALDVKPVTVQYVHKGGTGSLVYFTVLKPGTLYLAWYSPRTGSTLRVFYSIRVHLFMARYLRTLARQNHES